ncbi:MAG: hypothetical protein FJ317_02175, partial [SAR202 cluster bacterium]|nr:hypothetical protein [SAR202 cluster bacterium]
MVVGRVVEPEAGGGEMQFNVAQLLKEPGGATRRYEIDEDLVPSDGGAVLHVRGVVKMLKTGEGVWVGV